MNRSLFTLMLASSLAFSASAYAASYATTRSDSTVNAFPDSKMEQRDPKTIGSNTVADCSHGSTGVAANLDCTRNKMGRNNYDLNAYNTDTGNLNGARQFRSDSPSVDPRDGMTAFNESGYAVTTPYPTATY